MPTITIPAVVEISDEEFAAIEDAICSQLSNRLSELDLADSKGLAGQRAVELLERLESERSTIDLLRQIVLRRVPPTNHALTALARLAGWLQAVLRDEMAAEVVQPEAIALDRAALDAVIAVAERVRESIGEVAA